MADARICAVGSSPINNTSIPFQRCLLGSKERQLACSKTQTTPEDYDMKNNPKGLGKITSSSSAIGYIYRTDPGPGHCCLSERGMNSLGAEGPQTDDFF